MPPYVPYPLPSLIALLLVGAAVWWGADAISAARTEIVRRADVILRDQVPTEPNPAFTKAPIPRRGLLLRDDLPLNEKPDGPKRGTMGLRRIVDVLNVWPLRGEPTHYEIQSGNVSGWVKAEDLLPWDTRLVVRVPTSGLTTSEGALAGGGPPLPIVAIDAQTGTITLVEWDDLAPWQVVKRRVVVKVDQIPSEGFEVFLVRRELATASGNQVGEGTRPRAALGRLVTGGGAANDPAATAILAPVLDRVGPTDPERVLKLDLLNEGWKPDATWNSQGYRGVPIRLLP